MASKTQYNARRAQALTLVSQRVPYKEIQSLTGYSKSGLTKIRRTAKERRYVDGAVIQDHHVAPGQRTGRPPKNPTRP